MSCASTESEGLFSGRARCQARSKPSAHLGDRNRSSFAHHRAPHRCREPARSRRGREKSLPYEAVRSLVTHGAAVSRALAVWTNGTYVGRWTIPRNAAMTLAYDEAWASSPEGRPLSLSLPFTLDALTVTGERVGNYFDNLLPDSEPIRRRIASRYGIAGRDPFDLLAAIGRDCVGAVQLLPMGDEPADVRTICGSRKKTSARPPARLAPPSTKRRVDLVSSRSRASLPLPRRVMPISRPSSGLSYLLDAGGDRWSREEPQHSAVARGSLPPKGA